MNTEITEQVKKLLASPQKIVVVGHKNPDGDAIGSCLGLSFFLNRLGHKADVIMPNDFPEFLKWLPGCDDIIIHDKDTDKSIETINNANLIFTLDFNALNRAGNMEQFLEDCDAKFVMIDHHQEPDDYAIITYSDVSMSSTCEMVYHFIDAMDELGALCLEVSTHLYTGIMTDTGSFRFPSTTAKTHRVIAHLIEVGANNSQIHENIYDVNSPDRMKLLGVALNNLNIMPEYNTAYITLSQKELDKHNFKKGDTEGFVNYALSIKGVKFAIIFIENKQDNIIKMSLRSKGDFSVNTLAREHYNGGGHTNAAGGRSTLSLSKTISEFISILPKYKNDLTDAS
ncbi:DHH family phosphoesterase [Marixanthomonas ophiurae]|uniref:Bifunctional oligoribonuclease/PAP phosphatase NrnA n=1 Tax=Marixanthomonas ophiurae TaxID=387659 RepID=A0A3E1Q6E2_9FLAO|nr:bifunctional oligoribonuclease/PAP phosphatase NrnA [Marixanthomonas ophiurae]RFN57705.1 bifunctional oligoribonuclease/PAP phosphatase NrnA [Marixanthomonas ophiurae]